MFVHPEYAVGLRGIFGCQRVQKQPGAPAFQHDLGGTVEVGQRGVSLSTRLLLVVHNP
jgi:hypothetical protein